MTISATIHQNSDRIFTMTEDGRIRLWEVTADGGIREIVQTDA